MALISWKSIIPITLLTLAACGGGGQAAPSSSPASSPASTGSAAAKTSAAAGGSAAASPAASGANGYIAAASHDEIIAKAKQEGALKAQSTADPKTIKAFKDGFSKKYPFIKFDIQEQTGTEADQRFLLELKAGQAKDWDVLDMSEETIQDEMPYVEKLDVLGMAQNGVLDIDPRMVDPTNRDVMAPGTTLGVVAYNKNLVSKDQLPKVWEDLLKPEWKGRKMITEVRPNTISALVPAKGEAWVKDWATKMKDQEPVWARGNTSVLTAMNNGEYALHSATLLNSVTRLMESNKAPNLDFVLPEPVPVRLSLAAGVQKDSKHPYAGLLYLEYLASPEAQQLLDTIEPYKGSIYGKGQTRSQKLVEGKQTSVVSWDYFPKMGDYEKMILQAYGLPQAELKDK